MCSNPREPFEYVEPYVHQSSVEERLSLNSDFLLACLELSFSASK